MLEEVFETRHGAYQLDTETGLFTLRGTRTTPKRFLGSVDPDAEIEFIEGETTTLDQIIPGLRSDAIMMLVMRGQTGLFTPEFRAGYRPFGVVCDKQDIARVGEGVLSFSPDFMRRIDGVKYQLGSKILRVYRQLTDDERGYPVLR